VFTHIPVDNEFVKKFTMYKSALRRAVRLNGHQKYPITNIRSYGKCSVRGINGKKSR
jgi:hypothetical protein